MENCQLVTQHHRVDATRLDSPISIPPARLPARIDRNGLGGGSFFSEAVAAGVPSAGTEGAAAADAEAIGPRPAL